MKEKVYGKKAGDGKEGAVSLSEGSIPYSLPSAPDSVQLSWRPAKGAAAQNMQMKVENGLPGARPRIHHNPVSLSDLKLARELSGDTMQMPHCRLIGLVCFQGGGKVLAGDHQQVHRRLRFDIVKSNAGFILMDDPGGKFLRQDFAKDA